MCELLVCRICLNTAVKGYKLVKSNLCTYYEYVTRLQLGSDGLPQWVCYECAMMLHKFHKFKEKCLHGQDMLKQIALKGKITYESVSVINRYSENLMSSVGLAVPSRRVKTTSIKHKQTPIAKTSTKNEGYVPVHNIEIKMEKKLHAPDEINCIKIAHNNTDICNVDIDNTTVDVNNTVMDKNIEQEVKYENISPVKETSETDIEKYYNIFHNNSQTKNEKEEIGTQNANSDVENGDCDFDDNLPKDIDSVSSDDEPLFPDVKKRKVKRKAINPEPKLKKNKKATDKVELKNTKPKKHFLNPHLWKKISLSEEEAVREFKRREFSNDYYLKAKYKCEDCFKGFSKNDMLVRHLKHWHDESSGQVECRFCRMRFRHKHQLVKHMQEHLVLHHCLQCNLQFPRLQAALAHQEHHNGIKRTCEHCGKEFNHLSTYYTHLRMSHKSSHVCVACGASFVSENGLHLHIKFKHFVESEELEEKMRKQRAASQKGKNHDASQDMAARAGPECEEMYCVKCDIKFITRHAFNIHFYNSKNHDDDDDADADFNKIGAGSRPNSKPKIPTTCPHCQKPFPTRQGYIKHHKADHPHIPLNIPKKRDICEVCGASIQMGSIQYHMKSHTGERDFACPAPTCGMRFTLKYNMKRHYNVKHLGIPAPKYTRRTPGRRKKKNQEILENEFSPFVRTRTGYFL